jgi:hypothetical protein
MRDPFSLSFRYGKASVIWAFPSFPSPAAERFSAVPRSKPGFTGMYEKRSGAGGGKLETLALDAFLCQ